MNEPIKIRLTHTREVVIELEPDDLASMAETRGDREITLADLRSKAADIYENVDIDVDDQGYDYQFETNPDDIPGIIERTLIDYYGEA